MERSMDLDNKVSYDHIHTFLGMHTHKHIHKCMCAQILTSLYTNKCTLMNHWSMNHRYKLHINIVFLIISIPCSTDE